MSEKMLIMNMEDGEKAARKLMRILEGKVFDIVSFHTAHHTDMTVLEDARVAEDVRMIVRGKLFKIPLIPRRNICFDIRETVTVEFVSDRRVDIVRKLNQNDTVFRVILINNPVGW